MFNPSIVNPLSLPSVPLEKRYDLPTIPGIYNAIDSQGVVQYIGRSNNIRQRWLQHHRNRQLQVMGGINLAWLFVSDESLLPAIEFALIESFNPLLNRKIIVTQHPSYSYKGSVVLWKLREVMVRRKIINKALADELNVHPTSISRLKTQNVLPEIGGEVLGQLIDAIDKLSAEKYGCCTLTELVELVSDDQQLCTIGTPLH